VSSCPLPSQVGWVEGGSLRPKPNIFSALVKPSHDQSAPSTNPKSGAAFALSPTYCGWICPFKVLTEFAAPTTPLIIVQTVLFVAAFVALVVVLPLLTKRRIQCALFCPLGALQSLWSKINIFSVRIDTAKCVQCKRCIRECPTLSLDESSLESGQPSMTCTRCGRCMDVCPKGAISYHIRGTRVGVKPNVARILFMYPAWLLMGTLGAGIVTAGLWRILRLITTGSMLI
jgi:ferredoxin-type protein NapH